VTHGQALARGVIATADVGKPNFGITLGMDRGFNAAGYAGTMRGGLGLDLRLLATRVRFRRQR
jgi:hypothetical protein